MATVKLKYRPSTVSGKEGTLYFQIIHDRVVRQLATCYKIFDDEWNGAKSMIVNGSDATRNQILAGIRDSIRWDIERLNRIINDFDKRGYAYTPYEVIAEFQRISQKHTLFNFMQREITQLQQRGKIRTTKSVTCYPSSWTCLSKFSLILIFFAMTIMANFTAIHSRMLTFLLCTFGLTISVVVGIQYYFSRKT
jgi:hypothetical protein